MSATKKPEECFAARQPLIDAITDQELTYSRMPYEEAMQEGRRVELLVEKYGEKLLESDIDPELVTSFSERVGAFVYCVATFESSVDTTGENSATYIELKKEGYDLRRKIQADLEYIFRKDQELLKVLANIRGGKGDFDMFKDLYTLHRFVMQNQERLEKAHFNFDQANRAFELYNELFSLSAERDIVSETTSGTKILCQKAWTHLHQALEEIYAAGRYVFYRQPEIEELFYMNYRQKISAMQKKKAKEPETSPEEIPEDPIEATA